MPNSQSPRRMTGSRSFQGSLFQSTSSSRPFLNMLNPMSRPYQGYTQANQSLLEEEEEDRRSSEDDDAEAGRSHAIPLTESSHNTRRNAATLPNAPLHPNIHREDKIHNQDDDSDDGEVPHSFMIEGKPSKGKAKAKASATVSPRRQRPLFSAPGRKLKPILPTHASVSIPPRPSELDTEDTTRSHHSPHNEAHPRLSNPMQGADPVRLAHWHWVNVSNLDAFLQDVYYYYEGKGIYSIALSRGLNLL